MPEPLTITIPGVPQPQGSKRYVGQSKAGRGIMIDDNEDLAAWRDRAVIETKRRRERYWPIMGAVEMHVTFVMPRPKSHYGSGANADRVLPGAPAWTQHRKKPDLDKLLRALGDALTYGGLWYDDAQAAKIIAQKVYGDVSETIVKIGGLE